MRFYLVVLCLFGLMFSGCSLQSRVDNRLKRAERKVEKLTIKFPQLLKKDTLFDTITTFIPEYRFDTSFIETQGDTVFVDNERLSIRYIRVGDTVYLSGKCKADTITTFVEVPYDRIVVRKQSLLDSFIKLLKTGWWMLLLVLLLGAVIRIIWWLFRKFYLS